MLNAPALLIGAIYAKCIKQKLFTKKLSLQVLQDDRALAYVNHATINYPLFNVIR